MGYRKASKICGLLEGLALKARRANAGGQGQPAIPLTLYKMTNFNLEHTL